MSAQHSLHHSIFSNRLGRHMEVHTKIISFEPGGSRLHFIRIASERLVIYFSLVWEFSLGRGGFDLGL